MPRDDHVTSARAFYDAASEQYVAFAGTELGPATEGPIDRGLLEAFVEYVVAAHPDGKVGDIGCGPGRVASYLTSRGVNALGIDVSPEMVAEARRSHPNISFEEGRLDDLPLPPASLSGAVCWYSIIHTPPERLTDAFTELNRVLEPGGHLMLAFQCGHGETLHRDKAHGTGVRLTTYHHDLKDLTDRLGHAGFAIHATAQRGPELAHETTSQAFVVAVRR